jgi:site-specific DNA-methyltransferase (adenine-specific)
VLDPFMGAGTVGLVAERHHRDWLGIELNSDFAALARQRIDHERQVRNLQKERHRAA